MSDLDREKLKEVLKRAVLIVEYRQGDIDTEDGSFAVTDVDEIIRLEQALCDLFETSTDNATMLEISPKIAALEAIKGG